MAGCELDPAWIASHSGRVGRAAGRALTLLGQHFADSPRGYVAWSGGKDSTAAVHLARTVNPDVAVCWFHSGLEYPETEQHIVRLADEWALNLHIIYAQPDALTVLAGGGQWEHGAPEGRTVGLHQALIGQPSQIAHMVHGPGEIVGLRAEESSARRRTLSGTGGRYRRRDGTCVAAPVWSWQATDVDAYHQVHGIPLNGVYHKLAQLGVPRQHMRAGLVLDGNVTASGAATWLRLGWPELWEQMVGRLPRLAEWR